MTALSCLGVTINSFHQTVKQFIYFFLLRGGGGGGGRKVFGATTFVFNCLKKRLQVYF